MYHQNNKSIKREDGSVLLYTVLMLATILAITLSLVAIMIPKIRSVADAGANSVTAIYAADSAIEWCIYSHDLTNPVVSPPTMVNGATYTISGSCTAQGAISIQVVGSYRGVSRSLLIKTTQ